MHAFTEINKALAIAQVRERVQGIGAEVVGSTPEKLTEHVKAEIARWSKTFKGRQGS